MTKNELQIALAAATQTDKKTARVFLDTLQQPRLQSDQKERRIRFARFWQAGKAEEEGSYGRQSQDAAEDQDSSQDRRQIPSRQGGKGCNPRGKEVVPFDPFGEWISSAARSRLSEARILAIMTPILAKVTAIE